MLLRMGKSSGIREMLTVEHVKIFYSGNLNITNKKKSILNEAFISSLLSILFF